MDGHHVRMRESGHRLGLALQPALALLIDVACVAQELDRDATVELFVVGDVDDAHPARAEFADDREAADPDRRCGE